MLPLPIHQTLNFNEKLVFSALRFAATTLEKLVRNLYQFRGTAPKCYSKKLTT